jgi:hypothetical protein
MAFREVDAQSIRPGVEPDPAALVAAAQLAAIQEQLKRIEDALEQINLTTNEILDLMRRERAASAVSAVSVVNEVHETVNRTGRISDADWGRVVGVEETMRARLLEVVEEMCDFEDRFKLTGDIDDDRRILQELSAERWGQLVGQAYLLETGLLRWAAIYSLKLNQDQNADPTAVERTRELPMELGRRRDRAVSRVLKRASRGPHAQRRSLKMMMRDRGIPAGLLGDRRDVYALTAFREEVVVGSAVYAELETAAVSPSLTLLRVHEHSD